MSNEAMSLEVYKQKVEDFLMKNCNYTEAEAQKLMTYYDDDFQKFFQENWGLSTVAAAMIMGY